MEFYILLNSVLLAWSCYFVIYSIQRIVRHWIDGKNRVRTSGGRLITKIACTVACAVIQFVHIADYPGNFGLSEFIIRNIYFSVTGVSWLFSASLVYFDYSRTLKAQWRGQRTFWIVELAISIGLLVLNIVFMDTYKFHGSQLYSFDIIQIVSYSISILICLLLTYFAIFLPNDYSVIPKDLYIKLRKSGLIFEESANESFENQVTLKVNITGFKIKRVVNTSVVQFNVHVTVNDHSNSISRSLADFQALDKALREKFPKDIFPNIDFPDFIMDDLRKSSTDEKAQKLSKYLSSLCSPDFMTPDLLNFLQIEGTFRDLLSYRHNTIVEEMTVSTESVPRADSAFYSYYTPSTHANETTKEHSQHLQWMISTSIPSYRYDEQSHELEYYLSIEIPQLSFEKIKPYKYRDFGEFHKTLKKCINPAVAICFPSQNYSKSFKRRDKEAIDSRRQQLESYFAQVLNDPAYISQEILDFLGCDADLTHIYGLIPTASFRILQELDWEGEISSEDSSHFISYSILIGKTFHRSSYEIQWKVLKRYREFDSLDKKLRHRHNSAALKHYLISTGKISKDQPIPVLPILPSKSLAPLSTSIEIDSRKKQLEAYMTELLNNPAVTCSFEFRSFIDDKNSGEPKIN